MKRTIGIVVAFFSATVIEVVLTAGLIGIFIDSFAEKQLRKSDDFRVWPHVANACQPA